MARPKRQSSRAAAYARRRKKRAKPKLARGPSLEAPKDEGKPVTVTLKSTARIRRDFRRAQREEPSVAAPKDREILIVSRKGQPQVFAKVKALERKNYPPQSVSSSWLSTIGYFYEEQIGTFTTQSGRQYKISNFPFETFEKWYYALSKGTFFNDYIRDQYKKNIRGTL